LAGVVAGRGVRNATGTPNAFPDIGCYGNFASLFKIMNKMVTPAAESLSSVPVKLAKVQLRNGKHKFE
jgi:hypothetical protein